MRLPVLGALLLLLAACTGGEDTTDGATDLETDTDTDSDTAQVELPFQTGSWTMDFIDPEIDLCGYGTLGARPATFQAGGQAFEIVLPGPAPGPVTFDCALSESDFTCTGPDQLSIAGSVISETRVFGDLTDDSCSSYLPFSAETR